MKGTLTKKQKPRIKRQKHYDSDFSSEEEGAAQDAPPRERVPFVPSGANAVAEDDDEQKKQRLAKTLAKTKQLAAKRAAEDFAAAEARDESDDDEQERPAKIQPKHKAKIATQKPVEEAPADESEEDDDASSAESAQVEDLDELDEDEFGSDNDSDVSETTTNAERKVRKRNDPEAFATSISRILGTKLTTTKRSEPILARSKDAQETNKALADHKLTIKASRAVVAEKKAAQEKGHVKDVLGLQKTDVSTADIVAEEKRLRRTAQKGVIKLFNAVRAAQVKAEQAEKEAKSTGVVGLQKREELVKEVSKQGFLDMITGGGKKKEGSVEA